jgi:site-specific recombinase XerD
MSLGDITTDGMRTAFAQYAETHEAATIQRCWSTWNMLCTFLYTSELIAANPMPLVGRPKLAKTLPKALATNSVTALLAGLRADELLRANVGDLRRSDDGAVVHVRGKGGKERRVPIEPALVEVLEHYVNSRATRFPGHHPPGLPRQGIGRLGAGRAAVRRRRW